MQKPTFETQFKRSAELFNREWPAKSGKVVFPKAVQNTFWGEAHYSHVRMGYFYEMITAAQFGGKLLDTYRLDRIERRINPDIYNRESKILGESKACRMGHHLNVDDSQIEKYINFQLIKPDYRIYFAVWRHRMKGIMTWEGEPHELYKTLSDKTLGAVVLGFSVILALHKSPGNPHFTHRRYDNENFRCTTVASPTLNRLMFDPEETLSQLDLDPDDYLVERFLTPSDLKIDGTTLKQAPFVMIMEKDYGKFAHNLISEEMDKIPF